MKTLKHFIGALALLMALTVKAQHHSLFFLGAEINGIDTYHTDVYFNFNASNGFDVGYDGGVFTGPGSTAPIIYTTLVDGGMEETQFQLQALHPDALYSEVSIPLGITVAANTPVTISLTENTTPEEVLIILDDNVTGDSTILNYESYTLTSEVDLANAERLSIHFESTLSVGEFEMIEKDWELIEIYNTKGEKTEMKKREVLILMYSNGKEYLIKKIIKL